MNGPGSGKGRLDAVDAAGLRSRGSRPWRRLVPSRAASTARRGKEGWRYSDLAKLLLFLLLIPLSYVMSSFPTGYLAQGPGPSFDLQGKLRVEGAPTYPTSGEIMLTAVSLRESVLFHHLASLFGRYRMLKARQYLGEDLDVEGQEAMEELITVLSQNAATVVALRRAGREVETKGLGVMVVSTFGDFPAHGLLRAGEVITAVDGEQVMGVEGLGRLIEEVAEGEEAVLEVRRVDRAALEVLAGGDGDAPELAGLLSGETREVRVRPVWDPGSGRRVIGVSVRDCFDYRSPTHVSWELNSVRGPSAGLAMALTLFNALTHEDLTGGRKVAGTGEIFLDGTVGSVGGLPMKLKAAESQGAEIFLYPRLNQEDLKGVRSGMVLIPVDTLDEALDALRNLRARP